VAYACLIFFIGLAMALALIWYLSSKFAPKLVKHTVELQRTQQVRQGYIGVDMSPSRHIGQTAVTRTDMRPSGKIMLDGEVYDAVAAEGFIEAGQKVHIIRYENAQLYVTTIEKK
jgi:membrane-bound serine protease (ClpP class)